MPQNPNRIRFITHAYASEKGTRVLYRDFINETLLPLKSLEHEAANQALIEASGHQVIWEETPYSNIIKTLPETWNNHQSLETELPDPEEALHDFARQLSQALGKGQIDVDQLIVQIIQQEGLASTSDAV